MAGPAELRRPEPLCGLRLDALHGPCDPKATAPALYCPPARARLVQEPGDAGGHFLVARGEARALHLADFGHGG